MATLAIRLLITMLQQAANRRTGSNYHWWSIYDPTGRVIYLISGAPNGLGYEGPATVPGVWMVLHYLGYDSRPFWGCHKVFEGVIILESIKLFILNSLVTGLPVHPSLVQIGVSIMYTCPQ